MTRARTTDDESAKLRINQICDECKAYYEEKRKPVVYDDANAQKLEAHILKAIGYSDSALYLPDLLQIYGTGMYLPPYGGSPIICTQLRDIEKMKQIVRELIKAQSLYTIVSSLYIDLNKWNLVNDNVIESFSSMLSYLNSE